MKNLMIVAILALFQFQTYAQQSSSGMKKIIYVMDPHCGWCYGNGENITAIYDQFKSKYEFEILVGGMMLGTNAPRGGASLNQFIQEHVPPMSQRTGAIVSEKYYDLSKDSSYVFSSLEPSAAIVLIKEISPSNSFVFATAVQKAIFVEGKRFDKLDTYITILEKLNIDKEVFANRWMSKANIEKTELEFDKADKYAQSYPTMLIEENGSFKELASGYFEKQTMIDKLK